MIYICAIQGFSKHHTHNIIPGHATVYGVGTSKEQSFNAACKVIDDFNVFFPSMENQPTFTEYSEKEFQFIFGGDIEQAIKNKFCNIIVYSEQCFPKENT